MQNKNDNYTLKIIEMHVLAGDNWGPFTCGFREGGNTKHSDWEPRDLPEEAKDVVTRGININKFQRIVLKCVILKEEAYVEQSWLWLIHVERNEIMVVRELCASSKKHDTWWRAST